MASVLGEELCTVDLPQAYLFANARTTPLYCKIPPPYDKDKDGNTLVDSEGNPMVCKVLNLYGRPCAAYHFNCELVERCGKERGYVRSPTDPSMLTLTKEGDTKPCVTICAYVDDLMIGGKRGSPEFEDELRWFEKTFNTKVKRGPELGEYLGFEISKNQKGGYSITANRYIKDMIAEYFPGGVHGEYHVPAAEEITRQSYACSEAKVVPPKARLDRFQSITGKLLYLTNARPDIALAVGMCTRCMSCPDDNMMLNCERIAMYCAQTASLGLHYRPGMAPEINCEWAPTRGPSFDGGSDADWSVNRSTSGYCFLMGLLWIQEAEQPRSLVLAGGDPVWFACVM